MKEDLTTTSCQFCAEQINMNADLCKHCGNEQHDRDTFISNLSFSLGMYMFILFIAIVTLMDLMGNLSFEKEWISDFIYAMIIAICGIFLFLLWYRSFAEMGMYELVRFRKKLRRYIQISIAFGSILFISFLLLIFSFFVSAPPPISNFKSFLQEKESFTPSTIIEEGDFDLLTLHIVHDKKEVRFYIGAWNDYHCIRRMSIKNIKEGRYLGKIGDMNF
jgi:hypothetical protein